MPTIEDEFSDFLLRLAMYPFVESICDDDEDIPEVDLDGFFGEEIELMR